MNHSPDDPYVPMEKADDLAGKLDAELEVIENGGHLNELRDIEEFNCPSNSNWSAGSLRGLNLL